MVDIADKMGDRCADGRYGNANLKISFKTWTCGAYKDLYMLISPFRKLGASRMVCLLSRKSLSQVAHWKHAITVSVWYFNQGTHLEAGWWWKSSELHFPWLIELAGVFTWLFRSGKRLVGHPSTYRRLVRPLGADVIFHDSRSDEPAL